VKRLPQHALQSSSNQGSSSNDYSNEINPDLYRTTTDLSIGDSDFSSEEDESTSENYQQQSHGQQSVPTTENPYYSDEEEANDNNSFSRTDPPRLQSEASNLFNAHFDSGRPFNRADSRETLTSTPNSLERRTNSKSREDENNAINDESDGDNFNPVAAGTSDNFVKRRPIDQQQIENAPFHHQVRLHVLSPQVMMMPSC